MVTLILRPVFFASYALHLGFRLAVISIAVFRFFYKTRPHFEVDEGYFWGKNNVQVMRKITFK
jgi:hypothetical protein